MVAVVQEQMRAMVLSEVAAAPLALPEQAGLVVVQHGGQREAVAVAAATASREQAVPLPERQQALAARGPEWVPAPIASATLEVPVRRGRGAVAAPLAVALLYLMI